MNNYKGKKTKIIISKRVEELAADKFKKEIDNISFKGSTEILRLSLKNTISTMPRISQLNMTMLAYCVAFCYDCDMNLDTIVENMNIDFLGKYTDKFIFNIKDYKVDSPEKKELSRLRMISTMIRYIVYFLKNIGILNEN